MHATELREMLRSMQAGEMSVSRGIELVDMWLAGNYRDDMLPPVRDGLGEDEMPWDRIDSLTQQLEAARNCERVWETSMMGAVGEDGPGDVVKAIDLIKQQLSATENERAYWERMVELDKEEIAKELHAVTQQRDGLQQLFRDWKDPTSAAPDQLIAKSLLKVLTDDRIDLKRQRDLLLAELELFVDATSADELPNDEEIEQAKAVIAEAKR